MKVRIRFTEMLLGTVAKDKAVYAKYIATKAPTPEDGEAEIETVEEVEEKGWTGFHKEDDGRLFVFDYFVKGFFKHAGNVLKKIIEIEALRSKITEYMFIMPRKIYLGKTKPDGVYERPLRAQTAQGPRISLARSDYVDAGTEIEFEIELLPHPQLKEKTLKRILEHGRLMGMGQHRGGGFGRFEVVEIDNTEWNKVKQQSCDVKPRHAKQRKGKVEHSVEK